MRMPRTLMHMAAAAAIMVLACSGGADADPDTNSAYIYVSEQLPERLYLIDGGRVIFESPVNTGIRASPTPEGVFYIFASYSQHTMRGIDPVTLRPYSDANVPYAMYFDGGRAIHGFHRSGYGYPQSFGCIELPVYKARELYDLLQGGLDTEVVVARRRPVERGRAGSIPGWVRQTGLGNQGQDPTYRDDAEVGMLRPPIPSETATQDIPAYQESLR
jgi:hypothetical protein